LSTETLNLEEVKRLATSSHKFLCTEFLGYRDWDLIHDELEIFLRRPAKHKLCIIPRNHLKTSIGTIAYSVRSILNNPNIRILIANQIWDKSREMLSEIKQHLEKSNLKHLYGDFLSNQWNLDSITVKQRTKAFKEPTISTTGVGAESTGGHYDLIILDDLVGLQNYFSREMRERCFAFYRSMKNLMEPGRGQMIVFGTRWHLDDLYQQIIDKESVYYETMIRQVVEDGKIIFPSKFSLKFDPATKDWKSSSESVMDYIDYLKATMPSYEFHSQYMNDPIDEETADFKVSQIRFYDPHVPHPSNLYMMVDPAASLSKDADHSACVVMGQYESRVIRVAHAWHGKLVPQSLIAKIFELVQLFKLRRIGVEAFAYQKTLRHYLQEEMRKQNYFFSIDEIGRGGVRNDAQLTKEARIRRLQPYFEQGLIEIPPGCDWLKEELLSFPRGRHDDGVDAMASALDFVIPSSKRSTAPVKEGTIGELLKKTWERSSGEGYSDYMRDLRAPVRVPVIGGS